MPVLYDNLRDSPHYRRDAFHDGFRRHGFRVGERPILAPTDKDVLLIWNRNPREEAFARAFERCGSKVVVAENGYIGTDRNGHQLYAIALDHHSGHGRWHFENDKRWDSLNIPVKPWKSGGEEIVIMPQRSIGSHDHGVAMPRGWERSVAQDLVKKTNLPIRIRSHPGPSRESPVEDLKKAFAGVIWGSGAGIKCIVNGIPVYHYLKDWLGKDSAVYNPSNFESPYKGDRSMTLAKVAWAQWTIEEIKQGKAFECLLSLPSTACNQMLDRVS